MAQYLGVGWELFQQGFGGIWVERLGGAFSAIGGGFSGRFEAPPRTPVPSGPDSPPFLTTEGMPPRDSRDRGKGDRRSGRVDRNAPGRFRQALNRAGSGQAGHGPWEQVLI